MIVSLGLFWELKLRVLACRAYTLETGAYTGGASASLSGGGGAMCTAICPPSSFTWTGLAQVRQQLKAACKGVVCSWACTLPA